MANKAKIKKKSKKTLLKTSDLAKQCGVSEPIIRRLANAGVLKCERFGEYRDFYSSEIKKLKKIAFLMESGLSASTIIRLHKNDELRKQLQEFFEIA